MTQKKPGRPAYEPDEKTRAQVKMLAAGRTSLGNKPCLKAMVAHLQRQ